MVVSDLVRAALVLGFVLVDGASMMWLLYTLAFLQACFGTFFTPARTALVPAIVGRDHLLAANSFSETTRRWSPWCSPAACWRCSRGTYVRPTSTVSIGLAGLGLVVAGAALVTQPWRMLLVLFAAGWLLTPVQASAITLLQSETADELLGRIGSVFNTVVTTASVVSMALAVRRPRCSASGGSSWRPA